MNTTKRSARGLALLAVFLLTVAALIAIMASTAQAALTKQSETYEATLELTSLEVGLSENGSPVAGEGALLSGLKDKTINPGEKFDEQLGAMNTGEQPEFMRVSVRTYWKDAQGKKTTKLDPSLIELTLGGTKLKNLTSDSGWVVGSKTQEQTVLYSVNPVDQGGTLLFADTLRIDPGILNSKGKTELENQGRIADGVTRTTITYDYDGCKFCVDIEVDAVQTHNAADAIKGAWGVDANSLGINVGGAA